MGKLVRKNLGVDTDKVRAVARQPGTSESAVVRSVIDFALAAEEVVAIFDQLAARGGVDDVFGRLRDEVEEGPTDLPLPDPSGPLASRRRPTPNGPQPSPL